MGFTENFFYDMEISFSVSLPIYCCKYGVCFKASLYDSDDFSDY
jgi:hypothetical protein